MALGALSTNPGSCTASIPVRARDEEVTEVTNAVVDGFEGASFVVTDLEATKRFWVDYLGGTIVAEGSGDQPCQVLLGGVILEFSPAMGGEAPAPGGPNPQHFAFDVEATGWDAWAARAKQCGLGSVRVT